MYNRDLIVYWINMDTDQQKIFNKIQKCFALSESANPHEAAVALKQAHALAKKYNIDYNAVAKQQINAGQQLDVCYQKSLPIYLTELINLVNFVFQTQSVISKVQVNDSQVKLVIEFIGRTCDVVVAENAWVFLSNILLKLRTKFLNHQIMGRTNKVLRNNRADLYSLGWVNSIYEEIKLTETELDLSERQKLDQEIVQFQAENYALKTSSKPQLSLAINDHKDYLAYQQGLKDGKNVSLKQKKEQVIDTDLIDFNNL